MLIYDWYENTSPGLGVRFIASVEETLALIEQFPEIGPIFHQEYRQRLVKKFPYGIFYISRPEVISVHAVFHFKREPNWLKQRLDKEKS